MEKRIFSTLLISILVILYVAEVQAKSEPIQLMKPRMLDFMGIQNFNFMRKYSAERRQKLRKMMKPTAHSVIAGELKKYLSSMPFRDLRRQFNKLISMKDF